MSGVGMCLLTNVRLEEGQPEGGVRMVGIKEAEEEARGVSVRRGNEPPSNVRLGEGQLEGGEDVGVQGAG